MEADQFTAASGGRIRLTGAQRRLEIIAAAQTVFAENGLAGDGGDTARAYRRPAFVNECQGSPA